MHLLVQPATSLREKTPTGRAIVLPLLVAATTAIPIFITQPALADWPAETVKITNNSMGYEACVGTYDAKSPIGVIDCPAPEEDPEDDPLPDLDKWIAIDGTGPTRLKNGEINKCLGVVVSAELYDCNSKDAQRWTYDPATKKITGPIPRGKKGQTLCWQTNKTGALAGNPDNNCQGPRGTWVVKPVK
ncbi:RICIN domain-containing protein [Nocardia iowensis]|uniref:RICIN domain-containing protein n=1 Tax=Nocardia iowensis TaxID=204891 RepID=A0ABX8RHM4_NOCIO|nr:RICIN domain-containing protein [Nocardia iowensis]QXN88841.1 RICIN domain-containing protein [Nocardia iowensis]